MKFLLSALLFALLVTPVQNNSYQYAVVYTYTAEGLENPYMVPAVYCPTGCHWTHEETIIDGFSTLGQALDRANNKNYSNLSYAFSVGSHTPDTIDPKKLVGVYKMQKIDLIQKQVGTHVETITTESQKEVPTLEWSINE